VAKTSDRKTTTLIPRWPHHAGLFGYFLSKKRVIIVKTSVDPLHRTMKPDVAPTARFFSSVKSKRETIFTERGNTKSSLAKLRTRF
jgi:hypothetical protein